jgi:glucose/arabinose dehydrogenase
VSKITRMLVVVFAVVFAASCASSSSGENSSTTSLVSIGAGLSGPKGLTAAVYATGLKHASAFAFDAQERLWVATAAYTDVGDDGVYLVTASGATPVEVISGVHTPLGLLWYHDELYVSSKDRVDAYSGFDGTRFATTRTVVTFPDGTGENNGLAVSPDGHIVLGISAPCDSCTPTAQYSASIVSFLPDGSDLQVYASGIRAAVGLVYYPGTDDLFATMNQRDDLETLTPGDWLSVVAAGEKWGFPACYGQGGSVCTGVPKPTAVLDKHAAVSGVTILTGQLGKTIGTSAIVAEWAKSTVERVALTKHGSTYTGTVEPFLTGLKSPEPVATSPDSALLVGDWATGKIYRIAAT